VRPLFSGELELPKRKSKKVEVIERLLYEAVAQLTPENADEMIDAVAHFVAVVSQLGPEKVKARLQ
jgi:hypothetical protein